MWVILYILVWAAIVLGLNHYFHSYRNKKVHEYRLYLLENSYPYAYSKLPDYHRMIYDIFRWPAKKLDARDVGIKSPHGSQHILVIDGPYQGCILIKNSYHPRLVNIGTQEVIEEVQYRFLDDLTSEEIDLYNMLYPNLNLKVLKEK